MLQLFYSARLVVPGLGLFRTRPVNLRQLQLDLSRGMRTSLRRRFPRFGFAPTIMFR